MIQVPSIGSQDSPLIILGDTPGDIEIQQGQPFAGSSGELLLNLLLNARIPKDNIYFTYALKYKITKSKRGLDTIFLIDKEEVYSEKKGILSAGKSHIQELLEELKQIKANVIFTLGDLAMCALLNKTGITRYRGSIYWQDELKKKVIPSIHPIATLHNYLYRHLILLDLIKAKEEMGTQELILPQVNYNVFPSYSEVISSLIEIQEKQYLVAIDIEVSRREISRIALVYDLHNCMSIPFYLNNSNYFSPPQELVIWKLIGNILEDPAIKKVGQNLVFDCGFLFQKFGFVMQNKEDTLIAHKLVLPDYKADLGFITSTRTRHQYYKDIGKEYWKIGGNEEDFGKYNAKDSLVCLEVLPGLLSDLERLNNKETYDMHLSLIDPCIFMSTNGIKVDVTEMDKIRTRTEETNSALQEELNKKVGFELNVNSSKQVAAYFYDKLGIAPYKKRGAASVTTDESALSRIARRGYLEARIILNIRHNRKLLSNYLAVQLKNNRLVCSYNPITAMGRLSSSEDIFGFGTNHQNIPKEMNTIFIPDDGYLLYSGDLSQADNRAVAYLAPEERMILAFEEGIDVHSLTASFIFNIPAIEITQMDKEKVKCSLGYGDQTHRYWGKKANHSLNFGMGYKLFSFNLEIPESQGKLIYDKYHYTYPGVINKYHKWVQTELRKSRILTNPFGRKYLFKDAWGPALFNKAYAFPAQSNTSDCINRRGLIPLYYDSTYKDVILLRQVHDSIDFELPLSLGIDKHISLISQIKNNIEQPITWKFKEFSIPFELTVGTNLGRMKKLKFISDSQLKEQLQEFFTGEYNGVNQRT
jgi:DNA polymerase I-like protein with 3'-5' exonuclease and polymerase domains/uracil-DNA glycosylase